MNNLSKLRAEARRQIKTSSRTKKADLKACKSLEDILSQWRFTDLIPTSSKKRNWKSKTELVKYLIVRIDKVTDKKLAKISERIDVVVGSKDLQSINISVEWSKSRMWGNNAQAEVRVIYKDFTTELFKGSKTSGCGYDKESTAISNAINQSNSFLKLLYKAKNKNPKKHNSNLIGYGSGYGVLPHIEGGTGVSCMYKICEALKLKFTHHTNGKTFDVYTIKK